MSSKIESQPNSQSNYPAPTRIIQSRSQYQSCHINVPDLERPVPAISVGQEYYSFFRAVPNADKTFEIIAKLSNMGENTVITRVPTAYVIWVLEPQASLCQR
ncbi:MAG: hypothetical protein P5702_19830 [Limnospira sp. PMC 1291.21]|uniref:Uncharacterized protein n=3 Tax=Limnospira TaxID=2596745 RepID=A0A9P1KCN7_9CYAN|nr:MULTISPECIES: hypothetical protein [Limnospira]EKD10801.1 hypothetical protein SPLC1_S050090 [Arthrospira platensis C1]MDC0837976.1 hypothetical protein [Limnoraphis robusta]MDY7051054.1 hypothetical protein [Limnospira fusiformis LS22]QJB27860.1 hypothetical protein HFV01_21365 [Limnospira fusiformis SAG 85.79]RAQ39058.1 hypothetical protein B9S53_23890 [Arthrospira sp. O9.13F]